MKRIKISSLAITFLLSVGSIAFAHDYKIENLEIKHPYARMTPPKAPVSGGYLEIINTGKTSDTLVSVSVDFAGKTEIHEMKMKDSVMQMRPLADGIEIPPGETIVLKPGGKHIMFMKLKEQLVDGEKRKATLTFKQAGSIDIEFSVEDVSKMKMEMKDDKKKMETAN